MIVWLDAPWNLQTHGLVMALSEDEAIELIEHCILGGVVLS